MSRTYDRLAARAAGGRLVEVAKVVEVRGGDAIGAKDRPGHLTGASDQDVVEWAKRGHEAAFRELVRRYERPVHSVTPRGGPLRRGNRPDPRAAPGHGENVYPQGPQRIAGLPGRSEGVKPVRSQPRKAGPR